MSLIKPVTKLSGLASVLRAGRMRRRVALVCPDDPHTLYVISKALDEGIADFTLFCGKPMCDRARELVETGGGHIAAQLFGSPDEAAREAVRAVRGGAADVLMKGTLNTDNLLRAVLDKQCGLLAQGSVLTHVTVAEIPAYPKLLVFSDAAVIPYPTLEQFDAIVRHTVRVARMVGAAVPRVAFLHCTEKVSEKFPQTVCYEELKRRALRGDFGEVVADGPMDVKTALDAGSGDIKGIRSPVGGRADVLVFPDIEAGNTFYKTETLFASALTAGVLCGTTAPVVVASRADSGESKFNSLALACASTGNDA